MLPLFSHRLSNTANKRFCLRLPTVGLLLAATLVMTAGFGCQTTIPTRNREMDAVLPPDQIVARELEKVTLPPHRLAPPDVVQIDAVKVIPLPPYKLEPLDVLQIQASGTLPDQPIQDFYQVLANGTINLGTDYGTVMVVGLTVEQATAAIKQQLGEILLNPVVNVRLAQTAGEQQIAGQHLVNPDGTVRLGTYGAVYVTGLTLDEAKAAIEAHLSKFLLEPEVVIDMLAYNSRVYYLISDGAGTGVGITRIPIQGHETVLDAISNINGISGIANKNIWIARPAPDKVGYEQRLPVNFDDIVMRGLTATNYQVMPGDRIFIEGDKIVALDTRIARMTAPLERISGTVLLFAGAIRSLNQSFRRDTGNNSN